MPTATAAGSPTARSGARPRIAGDRGRRQPAGVGRGTGDSAGDPATDTAGDTAGDTADDRYMGRAAEILTDDDPLDGPEPTEPEPEPGLEASDEAPATATGAGRRPGWIVAALATSLVAVLAACVLASVTTRSQQADVRAGDTALAAARTDTARILSYDYRHLDADFAAATATTTGSFRTDYQTTTAKAVKALATQTKAVVIAKVVAGGLVSSSSDHATLLLFVDQTTTSNRLSSAKTDLNRVQVSMTRSGGQWLVSALKAL
jgi:Mce-associated membrane protein